MIQVHVLQYLIDIIYCHTVIDIMHIEEGVLFLHTASMPMLTTIGISKDVLIVCCDHNNRGGGVALIVNKKLNPKQIRINTILEIVAVKISEPIQMIVVSVYRPPINTN